MKQEQNEFIKIKSKFKYFVFLLIYFVLLPIARLIYFRKNRWIICERSVEAQDNGYIFYNYLKKNHPEIKVTYIIDKNCEDAKKFSGADRIVHFASFKHFLLAIGSSVCISSQLFGYAPWIVFATYLRRNKTKSKHIFLQHGIIKNEHKGLHGDVCKALSLFVCGAKPEYDYILSRFNYDKEIPRYTGLARFDFLYSSHYNSKNQILIMPTWRSELINVGISDFKKSCFFKEWNSLIQNKELLDACRKNDTTIKFYLHFEMQKYCSLFSSSDVVDVVKYGEETVQKLLIESKLLITDFSSVYFDVAYMNKPVIYYQFDESTFYSNHYEKGYFDYRRDGFGRVCITNFDVIQSIKVYLKNNYKVEKMFRHRARIFFTMNDNNNCKRIFEAIKSLQ